MARYAPPNNVSSELGYAEITAAPANGSTVDTAITGLSKQVTTKNRPVKVTFSCRSVRNATVNGGVVVYIKRGSTIIGIADSNLNNPASLRTAVDKVARDNPGPGTFTYSISWQTVAGAAIMEVAADAPAFILIEEL